MTGLDTNILVRYLTKDDEAQFRAVLRLLSKKGVILFVSDLVLMETDWVLTSLYDWTSLEVAEAFTLLLSIHNLIFEDEGILKAALRAVRQGADLSDELIVTHSRARECKDFATFDKALVKRHSKFTFIPTNS